MSKGQQIVECSNCGSNKVQDQGGKVVFLLVSLAVISFGIWIPFIGWFLMIPIGILMFIYGVISIFFKTTHRNFKCLECKHIFKVSMDTFKQYQSFLRG